MPTVLVTLHIMQQNSIFLPQQWPTARTHRGMTRLSGPGRAGWEWATVYIQTCWALQ